MKPKFFHLLAYILLITTSMLLATSCSASPTIAASPTETPHNIMIQGPWPTATRIPPAPTSWVDLENEIVAFWLARILEDRKMAIEIYKTSEPSMLDFLAKPGIIIWEKPSKTSGEHQIYSNPDEPVKTWTLTYDKLTEETDPKSAIQQYQKKYMGDDHPWSFYEFSIVSISEDGKIVKLFSASSCGPTCGGGFLDTLKRNASGEWEIIDQKMLWVS